MSEWISVEDRLPDINERVFARGVFGFDSGISYGVAELTYKCENHHAWNSDFRSVHDVTHWMPLPELPK